MNTSIVFFGTLRSTKLLKIILNKNIKNNQFIKCVIRGSKLKKIYNEVYPCLLKTNNTNDIVKAMIVNNLTNNDINRILFFESTEYQLNNIDVEINNKIIKVKFLKMDNKKFKNNYTDENWDYYDWKKKYEQFSCETAKLWMKLYEKYSSNPDNAEKYWPKIINTIKLKYQ